MNNSIHQLKEELKKHGVTSYFDEETQVAIQSLQSLKKKGIQLDTLLQYLS